MGLPLSRSIAEAHGGRLWYEPADPGSIFHLELPCKERRPWLRKRSSSSTTTRPYETLC